MGLFDKFKAGLQRTQAKLSHEIQRIVSRSPKLDDDTLEEIEHTLISADLGLLMTQRILAAIKDSYESQGKDGLDVLAVARHEVVGTFNGETSDLHRQPEGLTVVSMVGVNGTGKTTTAAKLAGFLKERWQKTPYLIAADLQRPAAVKQLQVLGEKIQVPVFTGSSQDAGSVVKKGLAESGAADVVILDTAGRLHVDEILMEEIRHIAEISSPHEILYVADGMTGQDAVNSSSAFNNSLELSGIILTKMDGDTRGGAALSIREVTGKPILFMGTGEGLTDFELFHPDRLAQRILGMGDVVSLVEKAQDVFDRESSEKLQKKMRSNTFTLEDFQEQLSQMQKMGPLSDMLGMIPGAGKMGKINLDDRQLKWTDAIIKSMTPEERNMPEIIDGSRRKRIARGSGRPVQEINQLLKQFMQMRVMMKKIGKKGRMQIPFQIK